MESKLSRRRFITHAGVAGAASGASLLAPRAHAATGTAEAFLAPPSPDPRHVRLTRRGWRLRPTGGDDRRNVEWALRNTPRGGTVKLGRGIFKLGAPVTVADFDGRLVGSGPEKTTLTCTDLFSYEIWEGPGGGKERGEPAPPPFPRAAVDGSATRTPPVLIAFYKTPLQPGEEPADRANRIEIRDLRCRGAMTGTPWCFGDEVLCINIINSFDWQFPEARQVPTRQDVTVSNVEVDGYSTPAFGPFENACACITILGSVVATSDYNLEGNVDGDAFGFANGGLIDVLPASGDVEITDCVYRNCRFGPGVVGYRDSRLVWENNSTDGCRANCLQIVDVGNSRVSVRDNRLNCDSFVLPPELANGATDLPSSLGCVVAIQGIAAATGFPYNVQWLRLANDPAAHAAHPEAGPLGTWRPQGPASAPTRSRINIVDNACSSSATPNTYCYHIVDAVNLAFGMESLDLRLNHNSCEGAETCISLEHVNDAKVRGNDCSSQAYGIELHNSHNSVLRGNHFEEGSTGCEVRTLALGEKIDLSRVVPGAGFCSGQ